MERITMPPRQRLPTGGQANFSINNSADLWPLQPFRATRAPSASDWPMRNESHRRSKMSPNEPNPAKTAKAQVNPTHALGWDVFVTPGIPIVTVDLPPGITQAYFQAMASTLIHGE